MRTVDADLTTALQSFNYTPYAKITALVDAGVWETNDLMHFELTGTRCKVTFKRNGYSSCYSFVIERGCIIDGVEVGLSTGTFYPTKIENHYGIIEMEGSLFEQILTLEIAGSFSYDTVIGDICTEYAKTAVFKDDTDDYWGYEFMPAGQFVRIDNPDHLLSLIHQKYFIFAVDNGGEEVLFYYPGKTLTSAAADWNYSPVKYSRSFITTRRNLMCKDEAGIVTYAYVAGAQATYPKHNVGYIKSTEFMPLYSYPGGAYRYADIMNFEFEMRPDLRWQDGDSVYDSVSGILGHIQIKEVWKAGKDPHWKQIVTAVQMFQNTGGGDVPYPIVAAAPFFPLFSGAFTDILGADDTYIQHAFETLDVHRHAADYSAIGHNHDTEYAPLVDTTPARYYLSADLASIPASVAARLDLNTSLYDIGSNWLYGDWYGASGAYTQADAAGCNATTIVKTGAAFISGIIGSYVRWASNAAGTLNVGTGFVTARPSTTTLTISKATGANFANSYYFWIKKSFYVVPATGLYMICSNVRIDPVEDQKRYNLSPYECSFNSISLGQDTRHGSGTSALVLTHAIMAYLTIGDWIGLIISGTALAAAMTIKGGAGTAYASYTALSVARLY